MNTRHVTSIAGVVLGLLPLGLSAPATADDLYPPQWRGQPRTTMQMWEFSSQATPLVPELVDNPYGWPTSYLMNTGWQWFNTYQGRQGVIDWFNINNAFVFDIPNNPEGGIAKELWIQVTYWGAGGHPDFWAVVYPGGFYNSATPPLITREDLGGGWWIDVVWITIPDENPPWEQIEINWYAPGGATVDQIVIDTWCVPEGGGGPANDDCANAEPVGDVVSLPFNTTYATFDGGGTCLWDQGPNIWYRYTATCTGTATVSLCGSAYDTMLAVYDGPSCAPLGIELCCNDDYCELQSLCEVPVIEGQEYLIEIGGYSQASGPGVLTITCEALPAGACCIGGDCVEVTEAQCDNGGGLYMGNGTDCTTVVCPVPCPSDVNGDGFVDVQDLLFLLAHWGDPGGPADINGDGSVDVQDLLELLADWGPCQTAAPGETIDNPLPVPALPYNTTGDTTGFMHDYDEVCWFSGSLSNDVVYAYTPTENEVIDISLCAGSLYDTKLYVYRNAYTPGAPFACNDDSCANPSYPYAYLSELLGLTLTADDTYYIVVDGYYGENGFYTLDIQQTAVPPSGETINDPFPVASIPFSDTGDTTTFMDDYDEVCPYAGSTSNDVVYAYTPVANESVNITLCGNSAYDTKLYVYENGHFPGAPFACNDDSCTTPSFPWSFVSELSDLSLTGGNTYYIVIDGYGSQNGPYTLDID